MSNNLCHQSNKFTPRKEKLINDLKKGDIPKYSGETPQFNQYFKQFQIFHETSISKRMG